MYYEYDGTTADHPVRQGAKRYGATARYTFQAILYPDGSIVFQYLDDAG